MAGCDEFHCDSLLLGDLVKILSRNGLLWPRPAAPFAGVSCTAILNAVGPLVQGRKRDNGQEGDSLELQAPTLVNIVNGTNGVHMNGVSGTHKLPSKNMAGSNGAPLAPSAPHTSGEPATHQCDATRLVASLDRLKVLVDEVSGLKLETVC